MAGPGEAKTAEGREKAGSVGLRLHHLRPAPGSRTARTRVGRGEASKGKTAGRGTKGTKARAQVPASFEGGQMPLHRRLPKRGFRNPFSTEYNEVNLDRIQAAVDAGKLDSSAKITVKSLVDAGICARPLDGAKILGKGALTAKLEFEIAAASKSAVAAIESAGASVVLLAKQTQAQAAGE
jgi:large subunit ribosomal protein L15